MRFKRGKLINVRGFSHFFYIVEFVKLSTICHQVVVTSVVLDFPSVV